MRRPPVFAGNQVAGGHLPVAEFPGGHALTDRRHSCRRAWAAGTPPVLAHRQPGEKPTCQRVHFSNGSRLREDLSERRSFRSAPVFIGSVLNLRENSAIFFALGSNKSRAGFFPQIQGSARSSRSTPRSAMKPAPSPASAKLRDRADRSTAFPFYFVALSEKSCSGSLPRKNWTP